METQPHEGNEMAYMLSRIFTLSLYLVIHLGGCVCCTQARHTRVTHAPYAIFYYILHVPPALII